MKIIKEIITITVIIIELRNKNQILEVKHRDNRKTKCPDHMKFM